jgi:hypothetical protein
MRLLVPLTGLLLALPVAAQCYGIPNSDPTTGNCNVIPFGEDSPRSTTFGNQIYQSMATAADLGNQPGFVTGLAFAPCGTGVRQFSSLTIKMGHCNLGTLGTTFAANFTSPPVTVLDVRNFEWPNIADTWNKLPLQRPFLFIPPLGDLVVEITAVGVGMSSGTAGMHQDTRQRVYGVGWTGVPALSGSSDLGGAKMQICVGTAGTAVFGSGCPGTNHQAPSLSYSGSSRIGQILNVDLASARATSPYFTLLGTTIGAPHPVPLDAIGMPGCRLYSSILVSFAGVTNASGAGTAPFPIPNDPTLTALMLFHQCGVVDVDTNGLGLVTSNAGWFVVGN